MEIENNFEPKKIKLSLDHNPYEITIYPGSKKKNNKLIIFPIFNFQAERQYRDLFNPILEKGYRMITISLLESGDMVLSLGYYYTLLERILEMLYIRNVFSEKDELILMGFGVGANLASHLSFYHNGNFHFTKMLLISPVNRYKDEYKISNEIASFKIPTYIFFGQFDSVNSINERYNIYVGGKNNPKVHFNCYPAVGHYLYYRNKTSLELERQYHNGDFDLLIGETNGNKVPFLPSDPAFNDVFFNHLFLALDGKPFPKRIALLTDGTPIFINGVEMVVELLKKELEKLGYETYVVALWKKHIDFDMLPTPYHVPIIASYARFVKNHKELWTLTTFEFKKNAKMLTLFGFNYLHLHTEYTMSKVALELAKMTGIKIPYTFHTLWKLYYENKFGRFAGDITYSAAKMILINRVYKECPIIIVPSRKSYEVLREDSKKPKDIRIIPSAINAERFITTKEDKEKIKNLREQYHLEDKIVLGYVGRVSLEKNITETIEYIAKAIHEYPNIVFMVVGVGDAIDELHRVADKLGIQDHVIYVGQVLNTELKLYYPLFNAFVTASNFETQGLTYFEAAITGTIILAKRDKAIEGVFEDGVNAYIYEGYNEWKERLDKIIKDNNEPLIKHAKQTMKEFGQEQWAKKMLAIYQELNDK